MNDIAQLRLQLQVPRKHVDTWYGRFVMRFFSIYITRLCIGLNIQPNTITFVSILVSILSALYLGLQIWWAGILLMNLWYLLDHVDGELARYYRRSSVSGAYFDTLVNFICQPLMFVGLAVGLSGALHAAFFWVGLAGAYGYIMLSLIPMCEESTVLLFLKTKKTILNHSLKQQGVPAGHQPSMPRKIFGAWHKLVTFPSCLLLVTLIVFAGYFVSAYFVVVSISGLLIFFSCSVNCIWMLQLTVKMATRKIDHAFPVQHA